MADDTYRRFHSGRFGVESVDVNYDTQIEGAKGVTVSGNKEKEKEKPEVKEVPKEMEKKDVGMGDKMKEMMERFK